MDNKQMWFIAVYNRKTNKITCFWHWADNADEAITNVSNDFFDSKLMSLTVMSEGDDFSIDHGKDIPFPTKDISVKKICPVKDLDEWREKEDIVLKYWGIK